MLNSFFDRSNKKKFIISRVIASFSLALVYLLSVYFTCGMWFETNDDVFITEMLSGKLTGTPEFHCAFVNSFISFPISLLYSLTSNIPWWGLFLFLILLFSIIICTYAVLNRAEKIYQLAVGLFLLFSIITANLHNFGQTQFTSASMILALTGYMAVWGLDKRKFSLIIFSICELLSCSVRDSAMLIIQPMGFCFISGFVLYKSINSKKESVKKNLSYVFLYFAIVILSLAFTKGITFLSFSENTWKNYNKYYSDQVYLLDYQQPLSYDLLSDIFINHNVSETEYAQYMNYRVWYPERKVTDSLVLDLLPRLKELRKDSSQTSYFLSGVLQLLLTSSQFWHVHQFTALLILLAFLLIFITKDKLMLIPAVSSLGGYLFGLILLAYRNKYALRVLLPYYFGACLIFLLIIWTMLCRFNEKHNRKSLIIILPLMTIAIISIPALYIGKNQFAYIRRQNNLVNYNEYVSMKEIMDYCNSHPENHYITDMSYERLISTDIFCRDFYYPANYLYSGSWYSCAPSMVNHGTEYIGDNDLFYLVYEGQEIKGLDGAEFYASKMCSDLVEYDTFKLSGGATIHVYRIANNSELK